MMPKIEIRILRWNYTFYEPQDVAGYIDLME